MRHSIDGISSNTENHLDIIETEDTCIIQAYTGLDYASVELDLNRLHSFIGTLLHVQQKLKNR